MNEEDEAFNEIERRSKAKKDAVESSINAKEALTKLLADSYENGFIDGMQKQAQSSVDKAVNAISQRTEQERDEILQAITDSENQPSQFGTVTLDFHFEKIKKWEDLFERMSDKVMAQRTWAPKLRFVERTVAIDERTATRIRILQQWWEHTEWNAQGEWLDVPLEKEQGDKHDTR